MAMSCESCCQMCCEMCKQCCAVLDGAIARCEAMEMDEAHMQLCTELKLARAMCQMCCDACEKAMGGGEMGSM